MSFRFERALELIERAHEKGRMAHAYLLTGPTGSGKERLAVRLIQMANGQGDREAAESLDALRSGTVSLVAPEMRSRRISVEAIRGLEHSLHMAAPVGLTKFAVVREADRMGEAASNAFLKTLEEPPAASRLILMTSRPEMLLDTILSRCIRVPLSGNFLPPALDPGVKGFLEILAARAGRGEAGVSGALSLMLAFSDLLRSEKEAVEKSNKEAEKAEVALYKSTTDGSYLKQREEYWKALSAAEYLDRRNRLLEYLVVWFGDALRQQHGSRHLDLPGFAEATGEWARRCGPDELDRRYRAMEQLRSNLATNVNETLALECAFLEAFG